MIINKHYFLLLLVFWLQNAYSQTPEQLPEEVKYHTTVDERDDCIDVTYSSQYRSGEYDNGTGGTPFVKFCTQNSCGVHGVLNCVNVGDWLEVVSEGDTARAVTAGNAGVTDSFISIPTGDTLHFGLYGEPLAFTGPVMVQIHTSGIDVYRPGSPVFDYDDGDLHYTVKLPNPQILLTSNKTRQTVWSISVIPDHFCPSYVEYYSVVDCGDTLTLQNPCPDPDFDITWIWPNGNESAGEALRVPPGSTGVFQWFTPCRSGRISILPRDSIRIQSKPILCTKKYRLSLPYGLVGNWSSGQKNANSIEVTSGKYWATLVQPCTVQSDTIQIPEESNDFELQVQFIPDTNRVLLTNNLYVYAQSNADSIGSVNYDWYKDGVEHEQRINGGGIYTVTAKIDGCTASDTIEVLARHTPGCSMNAYVPNAFSPNDDNSNDYFEVFPSPTGMVTYLAIFDRWGEKLFESTAPDARWDGTYRGRLMPAGVYICVVTIQDGIEVCKSGFSRDFTLIR